MKIGLFFGTFNPVHIGHIILANHIKEYTDMDEVWLVVTPLNPFKQKTNLLENYHRLEMVYRATEGFESIKASDVEFKLKQPNYTIETLTYISEKYPQHQFSIIMGEDNLNNLHKWKNYQSILEYYEVYVYPRINTQIKNEMLVAHPKVKLVNAPIIEISSTYIRKGIQNKKNITPLLHPKVWEYIDQMNFYK